MADERRFERSDRPDKPAYKKFFPPKKKFCRFCQRNTKFIDYKNSDILKKYEQRLAEEAPAAYKPVTPIIETIQEAHVADPVVRLKPLLTIKG